MNKILSKYLATSFLAPFLISTFFFVSFLLTFQLFRLTKIIINKDVDVFIILEVIGHIAISFFPMAIPLAAMFASMYVYNRMSEDSEIVAMRSFGLKKFDLIRPLLIIGFFIGLAIYGLNNELIPHSKATFKNQIIRLTSSGMMGDIKPEQFFTEIPGVILFAEKVFDNGTKFENLFIELDKSNNKTGESQSILATSGTLLKQSKGEWEIPLLRLNLKNGNILKINEMTGNTQKILFHEYDFPLNSGGMDEEFGSQDSTRSNRELNAMREKINLEIKEKTSVEDIKNSKKILNRISIEYWSRFNTSLQCIVFIFLGFVLSIKKNRGRNKNTQSVGLIYMALYYILFFMGINFTKKMMLAPFVAVFGPLVVIFLVCIYYYSKLDWQS